MSYKDFTSKVQIDCQESLEQKLIEIGAEFIGEEDQQDYYFEVPNGKLKYRKSTFNSLITHYERIKVGNMEKTTVYRYDVNPSISEIQLLFDTTQLIGKTIKSIKVYQFQNSTLHLDLPSTGGVFLEIEVKDFEGFKPEQELIAEANFVFQLLGVSQNQYLETGYFSG